jgi:RNA polymerase sigma-70 factor (ECF subfamily)
MNERDTFRSGGRLSAKIPPVDRSSDVSFARSGELQLPATDPDPAPETEIVRQALTAQLPIVRAVARNLVRDAQEVEDLVQDVYEKALRSIERIDMAHNPRGWMVTILQNLHIDRCRARARMRPHVPCDELPLATEANDDAPAWSAITTDDVRRAAARLPDDLRDVYTMFALDGRSYIEVAEALGIPKATVGTRLSRARAKLKELLIGELAAREVRR